MKKTMIKKSHLTDQARLKVLCDDLCDNIQSLLDTLNLDYKFSYKMISMKCPIHGGDNPSALNIYPEGDSYRGNWKCRTHNCDQIFRGSILGFIRGVLSTQKYDWVKTGDKTASFEEAVEFATSFLKKDLSSIKICNKDREKQNFTNVVNYLNKSVNTENSKITRRDIVQSLQIPSNYYSTTAADLFSVEILKKYDIGECFNPDREMYNRAVAPIYDRDYKFMVGCTGRSIFPKCSKCEYYHDVSKECPTENTYGKYTKWKHSFNFKRENHLYNLWFAKESILKTGVAILVESPGNVWRLEENNIHNSVALFGSSLTDKQKILLDSSGAMSLVIIMDNDEAGEIATKQIIDKCKNTYRIFVPKITASDVAKMTSEQINLEIKPILEKIV